MEIIAVLIPAFPASGAIITGIFGRYIREKAHYIAVSAAFLSFVFSLILFVEILSGWTANFNLYSWIPSGKFSATAGMLVDRLSGVMLLVVSGVGFLIHLYSAGYMHGDAGYCRYFSYLNLFLFSMLMLVLANNYLLLYVFWEAVGLCSYLLIGFWYERKSAADAGKKAFIVNRIGDFGFGLGVMWIYVSLGALDYIEVFSNADKLSTGVITGITLLLFVGAIGKSAQLPLYVWLPDAMEGPTPVSALIHAATMVTAGVYMIARSHILFTHAIFTMEVVATIGAITAIFAASIGLVQRDIKRILAYSTISQLGYMFLGVGVGAYAASIFHLTTHAFFKALLFLGAGSVIHAIGGEQDIMKMGGLSKKIKVTTWTFVIGALALSGIPPVSGFFSKDRILSHAFSSGHYILWGVGTIAVLMTAFYSFRLVFVAFWGKKEFIKSAHESPPVMTIPLIILAFLAIAAGIFGIVSDDMTIFERFLAPVFKAPQSEVSPEKSHDFSEEILIVISVVMGIGGIILAWAMYMSAWLNPERLASRFSFLYRILLNKYYVDELYNYIFIEPVKRLAGMLSDIFDMKIIDGAVNGLAEWIDYFGGVLRKIQNGFALSYAVYIFAGAVFIVGYLLLK